MRRNKAYYTREVHRSHLSLVVNNEPKRQLTRNEFVEWFDKQNRAEQKKLIFMLNVAKWKKERQLKLAA